MATNDPVVANEDRTVYDEALGINRKVFAGQPVPPDLVDAYEKAGGEAVSSSPADAASRADEDSVALKDQTVEQLQAKADELGLEVKGTGADGNIVKKDLVAALDAHASA